MTVTILFYNTEITFTWTPYSFKLEIINELRSVGINLRSEPSSNAKKGDADRFFQSSSLYDIVSSSIQDSENSSPLVSSEKVIRKRWYDF